MCDYALLQYSCGHETHRPVYVGCPPDRCLGEVVVRPRKLRRWCSMCRSGYLTPLNDNADIDSNSDGDGNDNTDDTTNDNTDDTTNDNTNDNTNGHTNGDTNGDTNNTNRGDSVNGANGTTSTTR